ncbi:MAG: hypothetical protein RLZZ09_2070 [Pseudomonadota bacterium]|jgi:hypothetical protein
MKILNLLNPIKNTLDRLATARIAISLAALTLAATPARSQVILGGDFAPYKPGSITVTATLTGADVYVAWHASISSLIEPTGLTISSGTASYRNSTTGSTVDLPGRTKIQGGADLLPNGPDSSMSLNLFAAWEGSKSPIIETTGPLYTIGSGEIVTISTMVARPSGEPMSASTINVIDFANTGATANPAVFLAGLMPAEARILRLQVMTGASLTANCPFVCL